MQKKVVSFFKNHFNDLPADIFLSIVVVLVIVNVILRYFFNHTLSWAEEVSTNSFVWCTFIGAAACYRRKLLISIDFLMTTLPPLGKKILTLAIDIIVLMINVYLTYLSIIFCMNSTIKTTAIMGVPYIYINLSLAVSFALMTVYSVFFIVSDVRALKSREPAGELQWK